MTLTTRITRTVSRVGRVRRELSDANHRMVELSIAFPADMPVRQTRDRLPLSGQHIAL
ncbi:MAG: hypothetical protein ACRDK8_07640 [Solirubrobacteraceae bacterium]